LSLRAIARDLNMASSAIYRYFPGRDELLTALIVDAYDDFGAAGERADAGVDRSDLRGRWRAVAVAAEQWSRDHAAEFGLIFGTPVPGYAAPDDTIAPATRFTGVLIGILVEATADGRRLEVPSGRAVRAEMRRLQRSLPEPVDPGLLFVGLHLWSSLIGTISFLRFGHFHNVIEDEESYFAAVVERLGDELLGAS